MNRVDEKKRFSFAILAIIIIMIIETIEFQANKQTKKKTLI